MQTPIEALVELVLRQQEIIQQLVAEVERLKTNASSDSRSSSSPPSSDIHKRSEQGKPEESEGQEGKRKPGGQPGHEGKTRKGFGRVDRYEVVRPSECPACGGTEFAPTPVKVKRYQVAELVERAIEVMEYEQQCCSCENCGAEVWGQLPAAVVGEQSLGTQLQSLLVWLGNYGHLSYEKQQELLRPRMGVVGVRSNCRGYRDAASHQCAVIKGGDSCGGGTGRVGQATLPCAGG